MASCRHADSIELCNKCNQGIPWCNACKARTAGKYSTQYPRCDNTLRSV